MNGVAPLKKAKTLVVIDELKDYYAEPREEEDESARVKIVAALQIGGAAAWLVHNAVKRIYDKHRKGTSFMTSKLLLRLTYRT